MTSRTHDNFRHNFWTWVDPPPPVWTLFKKTALFWNGGFPKCLSKGQCSIHLRMGPDMNMLCRYNWFAQAIGSFPPQSHLIIVRQVGTMCLEDVLVRSRIFYFLWLVLLLEIILLPELSGTCLQQYVALSKENKTGSKQSVLSCVLLARPMNMKRWEWWW